MTITKTSRGARDLAGKIAALFDGDLSNGRSLGAIIDAELSELLPYMDHKGSCYRNNSRNYSCSCGLSALMDRWSVK